MNRLLAEPGQIEVDLEAGHIRTSSECIPFEIDADKRRILLEGLDEIAQTMSFEGAISEFEGRSDVPSVV